MISVPASSILVAESRLSSVINVEQPLMFHPYLDRPQSLSVIFFVVSLLEIALNTQDIPHAKR